MPSNNKTDAKYVYAMRFQFLTALYDPLIARFMPEQEMREKVADRANPPDGSCILDVGCGTGTLMLLMRKKYPSVFISGVDGDTQILSQAREKAKQEKAGITFQLSRAEKLPFKDNSFDRVTSSLVFHHLTPAGKKQALSEIHRILKPEGRFLLMDWGKPDSIWMKMAFFFVRLADGFENTEENAKGKIPELMEGAGFLDVTQTYQKNTLMGTVTLCEGTKRSNQKEEQI